MYRFHPDNLSAPRVLLPCDCTTYTPDSQTLDPPAATAGCVPASLPDSQALSVQPTPQLLPRGTGRRHKHKHTCMGSTAAAVTAAVMVPAAAGMLLDLRCSVPFASSRMQLTPCWQHTSRWRQSPRQQQQQQRLPDAASTSSAGTACGDTSAARCRCVVCHKHTHSVDKFSCVVSAHAPIEAGCMLCMCCCSTQPHSDFMSLHSCADGYPSCR